MRGKGGCNYYLFVHAEGGGGGLVIPTMTKACPSYFILFCGLPNVEMVQIYRFVFSEIRNTPRKTTVICMPVTSRKKFRKQILTSKFMRIIILGFSDESVHKSTFPNQYKSPMIFSKNYVSPYLLENSCHKLFYLVNCFNSFSILSIFVHVVANSY
jgi:hypothetical protein